MQSKTKILKNVNWQLVFKVIKWLVPAFMALVLYKKFFNNPNVSSALILQALKSLNWYSLLLLTVLSLLNWGLETRKWQYLICKLELQSFKVAFKSVLCGITVAQMLPYRTGEYLGRLAYVKDSNKVDAGVLSIVGSFTQLLITLLMGSIAFIIVHPLAVPYTFIISFSALIVLLILGYYHLPQMSFLKRSALLISIREALNLLNKADLFRLIGFSLLRYFVFLIPYALLIAHFDLVPDKTFVYVIWAVACIYLLQTVSPNFILTDLAVRVSIPTLVLSGSFDNGSGMEFLPGMIIYVFNILIPMLIGALILLSLKLKK